MKLSRRRVIAGVVALVFLVLAACVVIPSVRFLVGVVAFTRKWSQQAAQGRNHLFFETDYEELLAACRTLSKRTATDESQSRSYFNVYFGKRDPETLSFPQAVLDLKPARVLTNWHGRGEVVIELCPGPDWFGVIAFPEGSRGDGTVKLIDGLWYFDSEYCGEDPDYTERVNAMLEKARQFRAKRASAPAQMPQQK